MHEIEKIPVFKPDLGEDAIQHIRKGFELGWLGMGSITKEFEDRISDFLKLDGRYVLSTNTGTSALHLGLKNAGISAGDEVITPSFNCVADHHAIRMCGAEVVMCDIKEDNLGMDCDKMEELITNKTKAIIPLHFSGILCDQKRVYEIAEKHNLRVIEDCCHAFGTEKNCKKIGSYGDMAVFSFDPIKTITSVDGGCLILDNEEDLEKLQQMRLLGMDNDTFARYKNTRLWKGYDVPQEGFRYHLNNILASIGISQIKEIKEIISTRQEVCKKYNESFKKLEGIIIPNSDYSDVSPFCYVLRILDDNREKLVEFLKNRSIDTGIHWTPAHRFSYFSDAKCGNLEVTEKISSEILTIPLHSKMKTEYVERIIKSITEFYRNQNGC